MASSRSIKIISALLLIIAILPSVSSFGVSSLYFSENPMKMYPGESRHASFVLQNMVGDQDLKIKFELLRGQEIVTLADNKEIYDVPFGSNDINVDFLVTIPEDAPVGTTYNIAGSFSTVGDEGDAAVVLGQGITKSFDVIIIEKPIAQPETEEPTITTKTTTTQSTTKSLFSTIIVLLVIIASIIFYFTKRKNEQI